MQKKILSLNGVWKLTVIGENVYHIGHREIRAEVPGTIYTTLLEKKLMPDPFYRMNELDATKLMDNSFLYVKRFTVQKEMIKGDHLYLRFDGIDTLAEIYLNGKFLGKTNNMHRIWEYEVSKTVIEGENVIGVKIFSPTKYIEQEEENCTVGGSRDAMKGYSHLRKAHCMFGWDWGPRLPDGGIFRGVSLTSYRYGRIHSWYVKQYHNPGEVVLSFDTEIEQYGNMPLKKKITVCAPDGQIFESDYGEDIVITNPKLWWPNGYGNQPLYEITVRLFTEEGEVVDEQVKRIGLRSMKMKLQKDAFGESFYHEVNGVAIFAMGADYIPEDNLLGRRSRERTYQLLKRAKETNANCIRVWGGGYYPDDYFYDICDELGLLVWQDFMFACSNYELTDSFEENIKQEIRENIIRIRHHACLALYSGNNEIEMQTLEKVFEPSRKQFYDYIKIFEYIIPKIVQKEDPMTFYWPSSPSSGGNFDVPNDENRGDVHYWDVWHGGKPFTEYRKFNFRYVSEFGFQSFPSVKTIASFTEEEDRNIFSRVMEMHQRNRSANGKILMYLAQTYLYPSSFKHLVYASQMLQLDAIRYGVEHFRRNRGRCMGAIVWQLNDIWPTASWSSIDYYGRLKALHYGEKRFFAPILISCEEKGELSERDTCIDQVQQFETSARLSVANETMEEIQGTVEWELRNSNSDIIRNQRLVVTVPALSSEWLKKVEFPECDVFHEYLSYRFIMDEEVKSEGTCLFTAAKHFAFENPNLRYERNGETLLIYSDAYAKGVEIDATDGDLVLSDNYFDMNAGCKRIKILEGDAKEITLQSVYDIDK